VSKLFPNRISLRRLFSISPLWAIAFQLGYAILMLAIATLSSRGVLTFAQYNDPTRTIYHTHETLGFISWRLLSIMLLRESSYRESPLLGVGTVS